MTEYILTDEEMAFMLPHMEQIMREQLAAKMGHETLWLDAFTESVEFKQVFGNRLWDDIADRFEDTPGYNWDLWKKLHEQLQDDIAHGLVAVKHNPYKRKPRTTETEFDLGSDFPELTKFRDDPEFIQLWDKDESDE